jgi:hypothetical protein
MQGEKPREPNEVPGRHESTLALVAELFQTGHFPADKIDLMERAAGQEVKAHDGTVHALADLIESLPLMRFETMGDLSRSVEQALRLPNGGTDRIATYGVPRR